MDLAELTNAPRDLTLGGLVYKVRALTFAEWGELHAFVKDHADDPVTEAFRQLDKARSKAITVSAESEAILIRDAREAARLWPPQVMTRAWFELLGTTPNGSTKFLLSLLRVHQPSITEEQAAAIDRGVTSDECTAIIEAAIGLTSPPKDEAPSVGANQKPLKRRPSRSGTTGRSTSSG